MKIVYNEGEKERLESMYDKLPIQIFYDLDRTYSINFKVKNPAIAQYVLTSLLHDRLEDCDFGIEIISINFDQIQDRDDIKAQLHKMIDEIV